ncbi:TetR/AcrR family transcriptional regulator [uncultured Jatrophihabitans sp.]|uniref:TetR/AcrR family transcriptional regulator n=1 Tax=uncultured Jatrophihabitans sp. TaxID=1610747 RepID=UPI0035CAA006
MARPKVPLISRRTAVEAALEIIDDEGLDALSIRRLADRLGVNGASLYHHFANKEEIVVKAAELALAKVRTPETTDESWHVWLPRNAHLLAAAVRQHPELVPVIVRRSELGMGNLMMESSAARLVDEGVPIGAVVPLLDALETFAIGAAIHQTRGDDTPVESADDSSVLSRAVAQQSLTFDEMYDVVSVAIVESVAAAVAAKKPRRAAKPRAASGGSAAASGRSAAAKAQPRAAARAAKPAKPAKAAPRSAGRAKVARSA